MYFFACTETPEQIVLLIIVNGRKQFENLKNPEEKYKMLCTRDAVEIYFSKNLQNFKRKYIRTH